MGTDTSVSRSNSSTSLPTSNTRTVPEVRISPQAVTTSTSETKRFGNEIVVRGNISVSVTVPIDVNREMAAYKNFVSNEGSAHPADTTASNEG